MRKFRWTLGFICAFICKITFAIPQVVVIGPIPGYSSSMEIGSSQNHTFTVTNYANHSWPFSLTGIANPVQRVAIANDCGNSLAPHATCQFEINIAPTTGMDLIKQNLLVNYGGRTPFSSLINIQVSAQQASLNGVTVGYYTNVVNFPLSYYTTDFGQTWTVSAPNSVGGNSQLNAVSCGDNARQYCIAGGYYTPNTGFNNPITYITNNGGQTWSSSLPNYLGARESVLTGIVCNGDNAQYCAAVGYYSPSLSRVALTYYTVNGGVSWLSSIPPSAGSTSELRAVSCVGSQGQYCVAVGSFNSAPLAYRSNNSGQTWVTASSLPLVGTSSSALRAVSCHGDSGQYCTAAGYYTVSSHLAPIVYNSTDYGDTWSAVIPVQQGNTNSSSVLNAVTCAGTNSQYCMAVGYYTPLGSSNLAPISYVSQDSGSTWTAHILPYLGDANSNSALRGVICQGAQAKQCMVAGFYTTSSVLKPITYYTNDGGETWTYVIPSPEAGASQLSGIK